jgi:hypothetical protein
MHMSKPIIDELGIFPAYLSHISISADPIRALGCEWIVNGIHCRQPCVPFLFLCHEHKNIPDFPRHSYATTCRNRAIFIGSSILKKIESDYGHKK